MSAQTAIADTPIIEQNSPTENKTGQQSTPRKTKKSPTPEPIQKHGNVKQSELIKWTVFVRPEVKIAVQKAAKKAGVTDTAWLDNALWDTATSDLSKKAQPPAKIEDVADVIKKFTETLQANQAATVQAQNSLIEQQGQQIAALKETVEAVISKPQPTIMQMIFGKAKGD